MGRRAGRVVAGGSGAGAGGDGLSGRRVLGRGDWGGLPMVGWGLSLRSHPALPSGRRDGLLGDWRSWLARIVDIDEVTGSSPVSPTSAD